MLDKEENTWKMSLISSASEAGLPPFFYSQRAKALLRGIPFCAILSFKFIQLGYECRVNSNWFGSSGLIKEINQKLWNINLLDYLQLSILYSHTTPLSIQIIIMIKYMKNNHRTRQDFLGPWQTFNESDQEYQMNTYCDGIFPAINTTIHQQQLSKPTAELFKYRPKSNVNDYSIQSKKGCNKQNRSIRLYSKENNQSFDLNKEKFNKPSNKLSKRYLNYSYRDKETHLCKKKSNKTNIQERKLHEANIQNFHIEGVVSKEQYGTRKKGSAFVLKHKFAEIRRSMNIAASASVNTQHLKPKGQPKENRNNRESVILKLGKYEFEGLEERW